MNFKEKFFRSARSCTNIRFALLWMLLLFVAASCASFFTQYFFKQQEVRFESIPVMPDSIVLTHANDSVGKLDSVSLNHLIAIEKNMRTLSRDINTYDSLQMRNCGLQDDIREETNRMIDKFNGWSAFWLTIFALLCGFIPLVISLKQSASERNFLNMIRESYAKEIRDLNKLQCELREKDDNRKEEIGKISKEWNEKKRGIDILVSFSNISSITQSSTFQNNANRNNIADLLLYKLLTSAVNYCNSSNTKDLDMCMLYLSEGLYMLNAFQDTKNQERRLEQLLIDTNKTRDMIFDKELVKSDIDKSVSELIERIQSFIDYRWHSV